MKTGKFRHSIKLDLPEDQKYTKESLAAVSVSQRYLAYTTTDEMREDEEQQLILLDLEEQVFKVLEEEGAADTIEDALFIDEHLIYSKVQEKDDRVIIVAYDAGLRERSWELEEERGNNNIQYGLYYSKEEYRGNQVVYYYKGSDLKILDWNDGHIIDSINCSGDILSVSVLPERLWIFQADGDIVVCRIGVYDDSVKYLFHFPAIPAKALRIPSQSGTYMLSKERDLLKCESGLSGHEPNEYTVIPDDILGDKYLIEGGYHIIAERNNLYIKEENENEFKKIQLKSEEDDEYWTFLDFDGKKVTFLVESYIPEEMPYRYVIFDVTTREKSEIEVPIDDVHWIYIGENNRFFTVEISNGKSVLVVYDIKAGKKQKIFCGRDASIDDILPDGFGKRCLLVDEEALIVKVVDIPSEKVINEISMASWSESALEELSYYNKYDSSIAWERDGAYFHITDQSAIYLYDRDGKLINTFAYQNENAQEAATSPYCFLSDDNEYLYYVNENELVQCRTKTGEVLNRIIISDMAVNLSGRKSYSFSGDILYLGMQDCLLMVQTNEKCFGRLLFIKNFLANDPHAKRIYVENWNSNLEGFTIGYYDEVDLSSILRMGKELLPEEIVIENESQINEILESDPMLYLVPDGSLLPEEVDEAITILKSRLDVMYGKEKYTLEETGDYLKLSFDKEKAVQENFEEKLKVFIAEPVRLSITDDFYEVCPILPEDVLDVEWGEYSKTEAEENTADYYFRIRFSEKVVKTIREYKERTGSVCTIKDINGYPDYTTRSKVWRGELDDLKDGYYYFSYDKYDWFYGCEEIFQYNLTHDTFAKPFNVYKEKSVIWEKVDDNSGIYQCEREELGEDSYYIQYGALSVCTFDKRREYEMALKGRLDALQEKYAVGILEDGGFAVQIQGRHMSKLICESLFSDPVFYIRNAKNNISNNLRYSYGSSLDWNYDRTALQVALGEQDREKIREWSEEKDNKVYLEWLDSYHAIAEIRYEDIIDTSLLSFKDFLNDEAMEEWYKDMIAAFLFYPDLGLFKLDFYRFNENIMDESQFYQEKAEGYDYEKMQEQILSVCEQATFGRRGDALRIDLHYEVNPDIVDKIFVDVENIFEAIDYFHTYCPDIQIFPMDIEGTERFWFSTRQELEESQVCDIICMNGRMEEIKEKVREYAEKDNFWEINPYNVF